MHNYDSMDVTASPSASIDSLSTTPPTTGELQQHGPKGRRSSMQSRWEAINRARECIQALNQVIGPLPSLEAVLDTEWPAKSLLAEDRVAEAVLHHLCQPSSGQANDSLCNWLYDTFQTGDSDLQDVVIRFIPALCGIYFLRVVTHSDGSLAGFEAVLIALYSAESKARNGRPIIVNIPDLSQPSLYHTPRVPSNSSADPQVGQLCAPLEPQDTVKATKRACIIGVAFDLFHRRISVMPPKAKIEACHVALRWASLCCYDDHKSIKNTNANAHSLSSDGVEKILDGNFCHNINTDVPEIEIMGPGELFLGSKSPVLNNSSIFSQSNNCASPEANFCPNEDLASVESMEVSSSIDFYRLLMQAGDGRRIRLSWDLLHPIIKILGHSLLAPMNSDEVKSAASAAIKSLHNRSCHDVVPEAILATRSLLRLEMAAKAVTVSTSVNGNSSSTTSTPSKPRKPEILLVSR